MTALPSRFRCLGLRPDRHIVIATEAAGQSESLYMLDQRGGREAYAWRRRPESDILSR